MENNLAICKNQTNSIRSIPFSLSLSPDIADFNLNLKCDRSHINFGLAGTDLRLCRI